jgi:hypothetical protein
MQYENQITLWKTVTWIVPIAAALLIGFSQWKISKLEQKIGQRKKEEADQIQKAFENKMLDNLDAKLVDRADKESPGFGISAILTIGNQEEKRKKFILDAGHENRDRVSLFLDAENNLIYRVIDHEGDAHIIKVPQQLHTFREGVTCYILLELGASQTYSVMRIFINDREVGRSEMDAYLNYVVDKDSKPMIVGADINHQNNGKFTLSTLMSLRGTLTKKQREDLFGAVAKFHKDAGRLTK